MTERKTRRPTCTAHCPSCNQHFHGTRAFDDHMIRDYSSPTKWNPWVNRCVDAGEAVTDKGQPKLQVWTTEGTCRLMAGCYRNGELVHEEWPVTIWQVVQSEAAQEALLGLQRNQPAGVTV